MPEQMTKQDAIEYLLYMKHDVQAKSPMDIALDAAIEALKQPTIEPEVRHGRWVEIEPDEDDRKIGIEFSIKCSRCHDENSHLDFNENHEITGKTFWKSRFCPNCGADMREMSEDAVQT